MNVSWTWHECVMDMFSSQWCDLRLVHHPVIAAVETTAVKVSSAGFEPADHRLGWLLQRLLHPDPGETELLQLDCHRKWNYHRKLAESGSLVPRETLFWILTSGFISRRASNTSLETSTTIFSRTFCLLSLWHQYPYHHYHHHYHHHHLTLNGDKCLWGLFWFLSYITVTCH